MDRKGSMLHEITHNGLCPEYRLHGRTSIVAASFIEYGVWRDDMNKERILGMVMRKALCRVHKNVSRNNLLRYRNLCGSEEAAQARYTKFTAFLRTVYAYLRRRVT